MSVLTQFDQTRTSIPDAIDLPTNDLLAICGIRRMNTNDIPDAILLTPAAVNQPTENSRPKPSF